MPDIAMCDGSGCPRRNDCYRHRATPTPGWQAYGFFPRLPDGSCDRFWQVQKGDRLAPVADDPPTTRK